MPRVLFEMVLGRFAICWIKLLASVELRAFRKSRSFCTSLYHWQALSIAEQQKRKAQTDDVFPKKNKLSNLFYAYLKICLLPLFLFLTAFYVLMGRDQE
jgi:hypothetical protein